MAKQKIVIKISMEDAKKKCKVLQAIVGQHGLISLKVDGDQVVVVGDGIDSATLTTMLRKKMNRHVELISVGAAEEEEAGGEATSTGQPPEVVWPRYPYGVPAQHYQIVIRDDYEPSCNIL